MSAAGGARSGAAATWIELRLRVPPDDADLVAEVLTAIAAGGVVEAPAIRPHDDADFTYDLLDEPTRLRAFFPAPVSVAQRRAVRRRLAALPLTAPLPRLRWSELEALEWVEEWKRFYQPIEVGERLLVRPSWIEAPSDGRVVVELDPGAAFGTGQHATTRLCLRALEGLRLDGARILDVGCGSGVLAIAAAKLGAREVVACDVDADAVAVARANVAANDVGAVVSLVVGGIEVASGPRFDIVVANISSTVTSDLAAPIAAALVEGGRAVLSGFMERDRGMVQSATEAAGLGVSAAIVEDGWCALLASRPGAARALR